MDINFNWNLINTDHLDDDKLAEFEYGIEIRAYACQRRIEEEEFDINDPNGIIDDCVNVDQDAIDEAYVTAVEVERDGDWVEVEVTLDFSKVVYS